MRYALAVLTHGDNADVLARTIGSFDENVQPPPVTRLLVQDGPCALPPVAPYPWECLTLSTQQGFCEASRRLWEMAARTRNVDYVFWLEHDFEFKRAVDLTGLAVALDENDQLAQVSLMRGPANERELVMGGVVGDMIDRGFVFENRGRFLEHVAYFTTTPNLMTRQFMRETEFVDGPECEGRMGIRLRETGRTFGVWGDGTPWVSHIGQRTGKGY